MELLKTVIPLFGVLIGWGLSEFGKKWLDKKSDRKKLNRLLFYLLELRFQIKKELLYEREMNKGLATFEEKMIKEFGEEVRIGFEQAKPFIQTFTQMNKGQENKIGYLVNNIDNVVIELAEIFPLFAYELNDQYNIKERLSKTDLILNQFDEYISQLPFDFKNWVQPKLTEDLLVDLDKTIREISQMLDKKTRQQVDKKLKKEPEADHGQMDKIISEYIEMLKKSSELDQNGKE